MTVSEKTDIKMREGRQVCEKRPQSPKHLILVLNVLFHHAVCLSMLVLLHVAWEQLHNVTA